MARSLISLAILAMALLVRAQSFGRFGYQNSWALPCLVVDKFGFRVNHPNAAKITFSPPNYSWQPVQTTSISQTVALNGAAIKKARANLLSLGFELYCDGAMSFKVSTTQAPYLTWKDGSVGSGVPTAVTNWVVVSFRDDQPPIAVGFIDAACPVSVQGKAGEWKIESTVPYKGWIRISAPNGVLPFRTNGAGELGDLSAKIRSITQDLAAPSANIVSSSIADDSGGVEWSLKFDRTRAVIPPSWVLAPLGGYSVKLSGENIVTTIATEDGPVHLSSLDILKIRFPTRRIPLGRTLTVGDSEFPSIGTVSAMHVPGVVELALAVLSARADQSIRESANATLDDFFETAPYASEPYTKQRLPFSAEGDGVDVSASNALLMQCIQNADAGDATPNALLLSLAARRDWLTGRLWGVETAKARRAGAIAALAGSFSPDPMRRLDGALFEAGVSAQRGLAIWQARRKLVVTPAPTSEPMKALRDATYSKTPVNAFLKSLLSEVRLVGPRGYALKVSDKKFVLAGVAEDSSAVSLKIHAAYELKFVPGDNVQVLDVQESFGDYDIRVKLRQAGPFNIEMEIPSWAAPLPPFVVPPTYSE